MNSCRASRLLTLIFIFSLSLAGKVNAQSTSYFQVWNEIDLVRAINDKWGAELDLGGAFSETPSEPRALKTNIQRYFVAWAHYFHSPRWLFSSFLAYYRNKDVPELGQYKAPEWRLAFQGKYYFHKIGYTLNTDMRFEVRFIADEEGDFGDVYRYRQKLKYLQPLNGKVLRKGVAYMLASEEIIIRSIAKEKGLAYFDCNLFTLGAGYLITDDFQIELAYVNVFIPRDEGNQIDNALTLTITFNNLLRKLGRMFASKPAESPEED
jgi:hypothetical protein